jgi:hypothetical protein
MFHVVIATPLQGKPEMEYSVSLARLAMYFAQNRIFAEDGKQALRILDPAEGCILGGNREMMVESALSVPDMTHLLWVDADMGFESNVLHVLASRRQPYVACNYAMKQEDDPDFTAMRKDKTGRVFTGDESSGLEEAWFTGFGMCLIERKVLEAIPAPRFPIMWNKEGKRWTTEDYPFCEMTWKAGFPVYVDHDASKLVWHMGKKAYRWKETSNGIRRRLELKAVEQSEKQGDGGSSS